jgi:FPC/CPF motif-containing protein YcgG
MYQLRKSRSTTLIPQRNVSSDGKKWHLAAFHDVESRLTDAGFPCVFSRNAFRKQLLLFSFVEDAGTISIRHLADALAEYVELSRDWDGRLDTAYPLVIAFSLEAVTARSVTEYHAFGWAVLQKLHNVDPAPWPDNVGKDPDSGSWSMCFNGMPLFFNMSTPAHRVRRSRNLGEHFVLVVNPRERFDVVAGDTPSGRKVRSNIRDRIDRYDGTPRAQQLGSYGVAGLEWWQYGLLEDNVERLDKCPFVFREGSLTPTKHRDHM